MAAPKRLAGGRRQVSLHLKASEPSVRRAAVPFSKTSRPFGANGGGATTIGQAVENLVPRAPVPAPKVEPVEMPVTEPMSEIIPEPMRPGVSELELEAVSAPFPDVAEFSSVGEPQVIEETAQVI